MATTPVLIQEWSLDRVLGSGGFGIVELWVHRSGKKVAVKVCKRNFTQLTESQRNRWINEVQIMKRLNHPNIVKGLELPFKHPDDKIELPLSCMEFCKKGDLRKILNKVENCCGIKEKEAVNIMKDISSAVEYLHSNNITHRDLKPENVVLQDENDIISYKLIDLGYAKELGEDSTSGSLVGTLNYVAPELLWKQTYSCSVDYWSLGILFYEVVAGIRPFLPTMQHTMTWMQYIKNKGYDDICAFRLKEKIVFGQDIVSPTNLSRNLRYKLVEWFKVVLQWDPKKRGKQYDKNGTLKLVVFELLHSILSKQIVHVFFASTYKIYTYEVDHTTKITDLQSMIEKDTTIPIDQQILTDYFGKILIEDQIPLSLRIQQDPVLFIFRNESPLIENIPAPNVPSEIQRMMELPRDQLDFETLQDHYKVTIFFIKQEIYFFQLYIFALTIKVDLVVTRLNTFDENMTNAFTNIKVLLNELSILCTRCEGKSASEEKIIAVETIRKKVIKLVNATNQIKLKFNLLTQESNILKDAVQCIDCIKDMTEIYNNAVKIYKLCKDEHPHKGAKPTEMVKIIFEFLKAQEIQFRNSDISKIIKQILKLEIGLQKLETVFSSVIAITKVYREELQNIKQYTCNDMLDITNKQCLNLCNTIHETTQTLSNDNTEMLNEFNSNHFSNKSIKYKEMIETDGDVIYDNLVIRYTLDNFLEEMQKKYLELLNLEP